MNPNKKKQVLLGVWLAMLAGLVGLVAVGNSFINKPPGPGPGQPPPKPMKMDAAALAAQWPQIVAHAAAPPRGDAKARYTFAEFGDFQCPQCGKARPLLEKMLAQYPAQANLIFLHRPFPVMHPWALPAGQASAIAAAQGKFWPMYDTLYSHQDDLETGYYGDYAAQSGLSKTQFQQAFDAGQGKDKVKEAARFADSLNIQTTPTLLVHDNKSNTVAIYVGMVTKENPKSGIPYPGIDQLVARPPWGT